MIHVTVTSPATLAALDELVTAAARCWRTARDERAPVQQQLYALLDPLDCGMLAPVFDSLLTLCEAALGRKIAVGGAAPSGDEHLLLGLLDGSQLRHARIACSEGMAAAFDCAIRSTRIMTALTDGTSHQPDRPRLRLGAGRLTVAR